MPKFNTYLPGGALQSGDLFGVSRAPYSGSTFVTCSPTDIVNYVNAHTTHFTLNALNGAISLTSTDTSVTITPSGNTINLSVASSEPPVVVVTGTSASMASNTVYYANNASQVELDMPTDGVFNSKVWIRGMGAGGFKILANSSMLIFDSMSANVSGESTAQYDQYELTCYDNTSTQWVVTNAIGTMKIDGGFTGYNNSINAQQRLSSADAVTFSGFTMSAGDMILSSGCNFAIGPFGIFSDAFMTLSTNGAPDCKGFAIPSISTADRLSITASSPLMVFDNTLNQYMGWNTMTWAVLG